MKAAARTPIMHSTNKESDMNERNIFGTLDGRDELLIALFAAFIPVATLGTLIF